MSLHTLGQKTKYLEQCGEQKQSREREILQAKNWIQHTLNPK